MPDLNGLSEGALLNYLAGTTDIAEGEALRRAVEASWFPAIPVGGYFQTSSTLGNIPITGTQGLANLGTFLVPRGMTISQLRVNVLAASAAGALLRLAIYDMAADGYSPGALRADLGTVDPTTTGLKAVSASVVLPTAGAYWLAWALQGTGAGGGTLTAGNGGSAPPVVTTTPRTAASNALEATGITGAFPTTITTSPSSVANITAPWVELLRSA